MCYGMCVICGRVRSGIKFHWLIIAQNADNVFLLGWQEMAVMGYRYWSPDVYHYLSAYVGIQLGVVFHWTSAALAPGISGHNCRQMAGFRLHGGNSFNGHTCQFVQALSQAGTFWEGVETTP